MIKFLKLISIICLTTFAGCRAANTVNPGLSGAMPQKILWAWEIEQDLKFLEGKDIGVAFYAQTLVLQNDEVVFRPRRQPLDVPENTYLIAVTRIETMKETKKRPALSDEQAEKVAEFVKKTLQLPNVRHVQTDFDVVVSEREFYRKVITKLKEKLPPDTPLTMTSLASWCVGDHWFNDFPVDEAVPMAFRMGADDEKIRSFLRNGNDWNEPLCRGSYGVSFDEPLDIEYKPNRRIYYFNPKPWTKYDLEKL